MMKAASRLGLSGLFVLAAACGSNNSNSPDAAVDGAPTGTGGSIALSTAGGLGAHLEDSQHKTLYFYVNDIAGSNQSTCTGACLTAWPAFDVQSPTVSADLSAPDFGRFDRGGGVFQATWKGRPLYYYASDTTSAPTAGEGLGGRWFVARAYNLFFGASTTVTPKGSTMTNAPFLTNGAGRSLYVFKNDTRGTGGTAPTSGCTGACATNWPLWEAPASLTNLVLPSTVTAADVTSFNNGGKQQFVYKGWPLYFFATDDTPGKVAGASVTNWGAVNTAWNGTF
jgi:predicted lipoprotein with Yx(FWY)xxD motif